MEPKIVINPEHLVSAHLSYEQESNEYTYTKYNNLVWSKKFPFLKMVEVYKWKQNCFPDAIRDNVEDILNLTSELKYNSNNNKFYCKPNITTYSVDKIPTVLWFETNQDMLDYVDELQGKCDGKLIIH